LVVLLTDIVQEQTACTALIYLYVINYLVNITDRNLVAYYLVYWLIIKRRK